MIPVSYSYMSRVYLCLISISHSLHLFCSSSSLLLFAHLGGIYLIAHEVENRLNLLYIYIIFILTQLHLNIDSQISTLSACVMSLLIYFIVLFFIGLYLSLSILYLTLFSEFLYPN